MIMGSVFYPGEYVNSRERHQYKAVFMIPDLVVLKGRREVAFR